MTGALVPRVLLLVCDGLGVGGAPDASSYGDAGADTLSHVASAVGGLHLPHLEALGLGATTTVEGVAPQGARGSAAGCLTERSAGKDSTTGHWELAGVWLEHAFPIYPEGFPSEVIEAFEVAIGIPVLGNRPASGTEIIEELGAEHLRTGRPIVYTSGDSVFQIAAHDEVADAETLYGWCRTARGLLTGRHAVGRVIARPFTGTAGAFQRTAGRRDYSVLPPGPTLLDLLHEAGVEVFGVGKIADVFAGRGISETRYSSSDQDGIDGAIGYLGRPGPAFVFANLVDFDSKFGHRNDPGGFAGALVGLDGRIPELLDALDGGVLMLTGDHGGDPTNPSTDHTRERVPLLAGGVPGGPYDLGTRPTFADAGATVADLLGVAWGLRGTSFAAEMGFGR